MEGHRKVGVTTCTTLVVANIIGSGVFISLGFQVAALPSPFLILVLWALGGVIALCGALCYAELAAALPRSGGEYNFLSRIYHPSLGFMAGLISLIVGFGAPIALDAIAAGKYLSAVLPGVPEKTTSTILVLGVALAHGWTTRASGNFQIVVTVLKVGLIVTFIGFGFYAGFHSDVSFSPQAGDMKRLFSGAFATSLMFVLFAYSGWNAAAYIIDEVRDPGKTIPRALLQATLLVTLLYVLINAVFLGSAPLSTYAGLSGDDKLGAGGVAARAIFGEHGGRIMSGLIGLGLVSALSAMMWAGPRVAYVIGQDFTALRFLAKLSPGGIPLVALLCQTALVLVLIYTSTFEVVLVYAQFALLVCGFLTVLGLFVLRWKQPDLPRPFKCWGYPAVPFVYLSLSLFTIIFTVIAKPKETWSSLGTMVLGVALFFLARGRK